MFRMVKKKHKGVCVCVCVCGGGVGGGGRTDLFYPIASPVMMGLKKINL